MPTVSVCFPVYNEEETVAEVLTDAHTLLAGAGLDYEILVCDDGSTDNSSKIVEDIAARYPNFRVIKHSNNLGIRATFEDLYAEAKKDYIFLNSADKQWETGILLEMMPLTRIGDIIIASRNNKPYGLFRRFVSWFFNMVPFILFGVRTFDAGAVKLVKREVIERYPLISKSPFSEAERLIRAARAGYRIINYPVDVSPRKAGRSRGVRLNALSGAVTDIFRVWCSIYCKRGNR